MKAIDYLVKVYNKESFNFQFRNVALYKGTEKVVSFSGDSYIRKLNPAYGGGMMTVVSYADILEQLQSYGAMTDFSFGHYDFLARWQGHSDNSIIHIDNDTIEGFILTAFDSPDKHDICLVISVPPFKILLSDCYNLRFDE